MFAATALLYKQFSHYCTRTCASTIELSALPNVDVFPLRNKHCYYVLIDTVNLFWSNLYCKKC